MILFTILTLSASGSWIPVGDSEFSVDTESFSFVPDGMILHAKYSPTPIRKVVGDHYEVIVSFEIDCTFQYYRVIKRMLVNRGRKVAVIEKNEEWNPLFTGEVFENTIINLCEALTNK